MKIILNGEGIELPENDWSVAGLLTHLELSANKIAIERNLEIVPASQFDTEKICDGDKLEIVQFVGGG